MTTDKLSLKWLLSLRELRNRFACWVLEIQVYDFSSLHSKGMKMAVQDILNRDPVKDLCVSVVIDQ